MKKYYYKVSYDFQKIEIEDVVQVDCLLNEEEEEGALQKWKEENIGLPAPNGGSIYRLENLDEINDYEVCQIVHLGQFLEGFPDNTVFTRSFINPDSSRYSYSALAFECSNEEITKEEQLKVVKNAIGETFAGYKGGDFKMNLDSEVHIGEWGSSGVPISKKFLECYFVPKT